MALSEHGRTVTLRKGSMPKPRILVYTGAFIQSIPILVVAYVPFGGAL